MSLLRQCLVSAYFASMFLCLSRNPCAFMSARHKRIHEDTATSGICDPVRCSSCVLLRTKCTCSSSCCCVVCIILRSWLEFAKHMHRDCSHGRTAGSGASLVWHHHAGSLSGHGMAEYLLEPSNIQQKPAFTHGSTTNSHSR